MNDIAIYNAPVPDRMRYAEALSGASLLPDSYRGKPANLLLALEYGAALGIAPMVAVQEIHIIKGKPTLSALLQAALVRRAGHTLRVTGDHLSATCSIIRADDPDFTFSTTWTLDRAKAAGLTSNDSWRKYPDNMLKARAISECARNACPDVIAGFGYTAEEMGEDVAEYPQTSEAAAERPVSSGEGEGSASGVDAPHQRTAASEPDIEDAVVVDDTTGEITDPAPDGDGGEAVPSGAVHPETSGRFTAMQIKLRDRFGDDRFAARIWIGQQIGRDIASTKEMDGREVSHVLAVLDGVKREAAKA